MPEAADSGGENSANGGLGWSGRRDLNP